MPGGREVRAGKAFVELSLRNKLQSGLRKAAGQLRAFARVTATIGATLLGFGTSILAAFIPAIKAASDMQETMSKFNTVFGESANAVKKWSDDFASSVGRSKQQIASFLAGSQDLFVPLGFDAASAQNMSKQITSLAIDLASFNNMADEHALRDLHAALTGSSEVMKKYGVIVNETAVKQELLNQGFDPKNATEQQKVMARLSIIMRGTTAAQGDAIRTSGSFANQMKRLKGTMHDAFVSIGTAVLPTVTKVVEFIARIIKIVAAFIEQNQGLVRIVGIVAAVIAGVGAVLLTVAGIASAASFVIGGLSTAISALGAVISFLLSPVGLIILAIAAVTAGVIAAVVAFFKFTSTGRRAAGAISRAFGQLFAFVKKVLGGIWDALTAGDFQLAGQIFMKALAVAWQWGVLQLRKIWLHFKNWLVGLWEGLINKFKKAWAELVDFVGFDDKAAEIRGSLESAKEARAEALERDLEAARGELDRARGELDRLVKDAARKREEAQKKRDREMGEAGLPGAAAEVGRVGREIGSHGTFSAAQAKLFGIIRKPAEERAVKAAEETAKHTKKIAALAERGRLVFS